MMATTRARAPGPSLSPCAQWLEGGRTLHVSLKASAPPGALDVAGEAGRGPRLALRRLLLGSEAAAGWTEGPLWHVEPAT